MDSACGTVLQVLCRGCTEDEYSIINLMELLDQALMAIYASHYTHILLSHRVLQTDG